jgi:hypothetical protein
MRVVGWLIIACLAFAAPADAEDSDVAACDALAPPAQSGCLEKLLNAADAKLNNVYQRAMAVIEKSDSDHVAAWKAELKQAEQLGSPFATPIAAPWSVTNGGTEPAWEARRSSACWRKPNNVPANWSGVISIGTEQRR